jgi:hypothetical protein
MSAQRATVGCPSRDLLRGWGEVERLLWVALLNYLNVFFSCVISPFLGFDRQFHVQILKAGHLLFEGFNRRFTLMVDHPSCFRPNLVYVLNLLDAFHCFHLNNRIQFDFLSPSREHLLLRICWVAGAFDWKMIYHLSRPVKEVVGWIDVKLS